MKFVVTLSGVLILASSVLAQEAAEVAVEASELETTVVETAPVSTPAPAPRGRASQPVTNRFVEPEAIVDLATPVTNDTLSRPRIDNPISVAQFSGDDLLLRGVGVERNEIFLRTANATALPGGTGSFTIRGINDSAITESLDTGSNSLATVFINQAPISKDNLAYLPPTLWDVEKVEILRGPQSVYQGPNSLAGAVFYDYKDPTFEWEGRSRFEVAERDTINWAITQNIPLIDEVLATRISYERYVSDGYVNNITRNEDDYRNIDRQYLRLQTLWRPQGNDDATINFTYRYSQDRGNDILSLHGTQTPLFDRTSTFDNDDFYDADGHDFIIEGHFRLNDAWTLDTVTSLQSFNWRSNFEGDLTSFPILSFDSFIDEYLYTQELRFSFDDGGPLRATAGFYGQYNDYSNGFGSDFAFSTDVSEIGRVAAVFANAEYDLNDRLTMGAGVRLNYEERDVSASFAIPPFFGGTVDQSDDFFDVLPQWSISYRIDENQTFGGLISRGYRSGGVAVAPGAGRAETYEPESTWNYELFYRGSFLDGKLRVNSNLFYTDWEDQQIPVEVPSFFPIPILSSLVQNVGESELYGWEMELEYDITTEWSLFATAGWSSTNFGSYQLTPTNNLDGQSFPNAPEWTTSLGVQYIGENGIFGSTTWSYQDSTYSNATNPNTTQIEAFHLLSAKLGYGRNNWKVYGFVDNLLGEDYPLTLVDRTAAIPGTNVHGIASEPRTYGFGVEVEW